MGRLIPREVREFLERGRQAYERLDPEDRMRAHVETGYPLRPEDARLMLDRLDKRDGCHMRETALAGAVAAFLHVLDTTTRPAQPAIDDAAAAMRAVLAEQVHPGRACSCPRDPDDEVDPGDPISTCRVHGWA